MTKIPKDKLQPCWSLVQHALGASRREAHQPQLLALWHSNNHSQIIIGNIQDNLVLGNDQAPAPVAMWAESSIGLT